MGILDSVSGMIGTVSKGAKNVLTTGVVNGANFNYGFETIGYTDKDIPDEYLVKVILRRSNYYTRDTDQSGIVIIKCPIQEKFSTETEATWSPMSCSGILNKVSDEITQSFTGRSTVTKYTTRRIWTASSPLTFTLNFRFEAKRDTELEVMRPFRELQKLVLPYSGKRRSDSVVPTANDMFLFPPGPNPFEGLREAVGLGYTGSPGERVDIVIGRLMTISNVVVGRVNTEYPIRFEKGGNVVGAVVSVTFQTFEIQTKESIDNVYSTRLYTDVVSSRERESLEYNIRKDTGKSGMQNAREFSDNWLSEQP